jgi:hypothetical protein
MLRALLCCLKTLMLTDSHIHSTRQIFFAAGAAVFTDSRLTALLIITDSPSTNG